MDDILKPHKKNWRKTDPLVIELTNQVRIKITGSKDSLMSQDDFSHLTEHINIQIDDRTIKEYFGHYRTRTEGCNINILNAFAIYLGYKDFYAFKKENDIISLKKPDEAIIPSKLEEPIDVKNNGKKKRSKIILLTIVAFVFSG
jgi:hypothetical protein